MRFHFGLSFRPKDFFKWGALIIGGLLAFFGISQVNALTQFTPNTAWVTTDIKEAFYTCDATTDICTWIADNTTSTSGNIPWTSAYIQGQDYESTDEYIVEAIRVMGIGIYNNSSASGTIPANSVVTIKLQFTNLDKFTKGSNFNNPGLAVRTTSNTNQYGAFDQTFVCNGNSCTLTYKTPNVATKGAFFYWNISSTDYNNFFVRNDTSIDYKLGISSYSFSYENSSAETTNAINQQTQIISSWDSTINNSINRIGETLARVFGNGTSEIKDTITDSSVDDKSSFFNNFNDNSHGLSGIVTAPLVLVRGLNSGTSCDPLTFSILGQSVSMPSGCILWGEVPSSIETIYFVFIGGFFGYILVTKLFHDVNRLKDPSDSEVSTLDL